MTYKYLNINNQMDKMLQMIYEDTLKDSSYMDAFKRKDYSTLEKMVLNAAKSKGYTGSFSHGSSMGKFNVFKLPHPKEVGYARYGPGIYLANVQDEKTLSVYSKGGGIMNFYVDMSNLVRSLTDQQIKDIISTMDPNKTFKDGTTVGLYIKSYLNNKEINNIGIFWNLLQVTGYSSNWYNYMKDIGVEGCIAKFADLDDGEVVLYKNTKLKSSDPVTYDDNNNIIPLSRRFDLDEEDIRY
jgi:hypothetical protein